MQSLCWRFTGMFSNFQVVSAPEKTAQKLLNQKNNLYFDSKLENDLALRLGLINELRYSKNERKIIQILAEGWDPGHLHWPSGRFKLGLWDVKKMTLDPVWVVLKAIVKAVGWVLLCLCA